MKKTIVALMIGLFVLAPSIARAKEVPTEAQLRQLFESVARVAPEKVRVISLYERETAPPSEVEIQKVLDRFRKVDEKTSEGAPEPMRTQRIEEHARVIRSSMTGKTHAKIQEWESGSLYRRDEAVGRFSLEEAVRKTNCDLTYINLANETNGTMSKVRINHDTGSFEVNHDNKQSPYSEVGAWKAMLVEGRVAFVVALALASKDSLGRKAQDEHQKMLIDPVKLRRLLSGQNPAFKVSLDEKVVDGRQLDDFEFEFLEPTQPGNRVTVLIECEKTNYNRITRTEIKDKEGVMALSSVRKGFDSQDFPHEYTLIENGKNGYTTNRFLIHEVELNAHFSDDAVFRFAPDKNSYTVWDMTSGTAKNVSWAGGKPKRIVDVWGTSNKSGWVARWVENRTTIRVVIICACLLPPVVMTLVFLKRRRSQ